MGEIRISKNEQRFDNVKSNLENLVQALQKFKDTQQDYIQLNKYYGSKAWFKDKEDYENNKLPKVKAGVLSEDAVWNLNEEIDDALKQMSQIETNFGKSSSREIVK